jgi:membrane-associated PAP2 superfamily phosphatase
MTAAIVLLAGPALLLDAAAPAAAGGWVAWHAVSTAALAALSLWALWSPQLPREAGQAVARGVSLLMIAALCVAAQGAPMDDASTFTTTLAVLTALAASLFVVGARWARREIHW